MQTDPKVTEDSRLLIGCDPEFFLWNKKKHSFVSAHDLLPGDKKTPFKVPHGAVQVDGTAVEFNIDPAATSEEFKHNIAEVLLNLRKMVPNNYSFVFTPIIKYHKNYFEALPKNTKELGCDPDFNIYTKSVNAIPDDIGTFRTGSGHIHLGWTEGEDTSASSQHFQDAMMMVNALDNHLAPLLRKVEGDDVKERQRRKFYGSHGSFRCKSYGVEYRTPSNSWLNNINSWERIFKRTSNIYQAMCEDAIKTAFFGSLRVPNKDTRKALAL